MAGVYDGSARDCDTEMGEESPVETEPTESTRSSRRNTSKAAKSSRRNASTPSEAAPPPGTAVTMTPAIGAPDTLFGLLGELVKIPVACVLVVTLWINLSWLFQGEVGKTLLLALCLVLSFVALILPGSVRQAWFYLPFAGIFTLYYAKWGYTWLGVIATVLVVIGTLLFLRGFFSKRRGKKKYSPSPAGGFSVRPALPSPRGQRSVP